MKTPPKQIIEIADYIFVHPGEKVQNVIALFCPKLHRRERTIKTYIKQAKAYNRQRLQKTNEAQDRVLIADATKEAENALNRRKKCIEVLEKIIEGGARKIPTATKIIGNVETPTDFTLEYPSDGDRIRAVAQLSKMEGWETIKIDATTEVVLDPFAQMRKNHGID